MGEHNPRAYARFRTKVKPLADGSVDDCWIWQAATDGSGYGRFNDGTRIVPSHLFAWRELRGEVPRHLVADHTCRRRNCVNPWHLELVPRATNVLRGDKFGLRDTYATTISECQRGHPLVGSNVYVSGRNRCCRTCRNEAQRRRRATPAT